MSQNLLLLLLVLLPCDVCPEEAQSRNKRDCTIAVYTREKSRTLREIFEKGGGAEHGSAGEGGREGGGEGGREAVRDGGNAEGFFVATILLFVAGYLWSSNLHPPPPQLDTS